jgi:hypothetical protein
VALDGYREDEVLRLAAALERRSEHRSPMPSSRPQTVGCCRK